MFLSALSPGAFAGGSPTFVNRAVEAGADLVGFGKAAAMVDLDGDGRLDLIAVDHLQDNEFLRQLPDHTFSNATRDWGGPFISVSSWGVLATDFDDDGDCDVYFLAGGFVQSEANQLLRNDIDSAGGLTDRSAASGDANLVRQTQGGTVLDYDRDGDLDIFCSNDAMQSCTLLRNDGELVFTDVSQEALIAHPGEHRHCTSGDYDNDGWIDVAVGESAVQGGPMLHFGLGADDAYERIELLWPSGVRQTLLTAPLDGRISVEETGLRLSGPAVLGTSIQLDACGKAGYAVDLFLSGQTTYLPLPDYGGVLELAAPNYALTLPLGPGGVAALPIDVPSVAGLVGQVLNMQGYVRDAAFQDGTISNRVELRFE